MLTHYLMKTKATNLKSGDIVMENLADVDMENVAMHKGAEPVINYMLRYMEDESDYLVVDEEMLAEMEQIDPNMKGFIDAGRAVFKAGECLLYSTSQ